MLLLPILAHKLGKAVSNDSNKVNGKTNTIEITSMHISPPAVAAGNNYVSLNGKLDSILTIEKERKNSLVCIDQYGCWLKNVLRIVIQDNKRFQNCSCDVHEFNCCHE